MVNDILLYLIMFIHLFIWLFVMFGGMISIDYAEFNIIYFIPIIYLSYILFNDCVLNKLEFNMADNLDTLDLYNFNKSVFKHSFQNPLSAHGMLILGFIIGVYTLEYHKTNHS